MEFRTGNLVQPDREVMWPEISGSEVEFRALLFISLPATRSYKMQRFY